MGEEHAGAPLPFRKPVQFLLSAPSPKFFPPPSLPEIAVVGRSNVGKSSLINALLGHGAARTSKTPGRTREINFFIVGGSEPLFHLVDLPGYGYAKISKSDHKHWRDLCETYLAQRPSLRRVLLLVDSRHPIKENDLQMLSALAGWRVPVSIVLTKCDGTKKADVQKHLDHFPALQSEFISLVPPMLPTSSDKRQGIYALQSTILEMVDHQGE